MLKHMNYNNDGSVTVTWLTEDLEEAKEYKKSLIKQFCQQSILEQVPLEKQASAIAGHYPKEKTGAINKFIRDCLKSCDEAEALIDAATTLDEVNNVVWQCKSYDEVKNKKPWWRFW